MREIRCALCNGNETIPFLTVPDRYFPADKRKYTLVQCSQCGLVYLNPQPTMEEMARYYPSEYAPYLTEYDVLAHNRLYEVIKKIQRLFRRNVKILATPDQTKEKEVDMQTRLKVLDFGCGSGRFLLNLKAAHPLWDLYGFDIGTNEEIRNIDTAIKVIVDTPSSLSIHFAKESFGRIYLNNVLEHVNDPILTLQNLAMLLQPHGTMVIEVPNIDSIKFKIFRSKYSVLELPRHLYHFSPKTLTELCQKCGLSVEGIEKTGASKSTVRSIFYALGMYQDKVDPLLLWVVDKLTKLVGEKKINDDSMIAQVKKI